jgi:hypothetical protein
MENNHDQMKLDLTEKGQRLSQLDKQIMQLEKLKHQHE